MASSQASPMLVLVGLSGRSLRLDAHGAVRVDAVQQALLSFTGIPLADQLVMYNGSRLDPARTLGSYGLPVADAGMAEDSPVFLYSRSLLKPGARVPESEALPDIVATVPPPPSVLQLHHPLTSASSPLVRALPQTELQFQHDLATAKAYWDTSQLRVQRCRQLLSEQEVQARAADAARANVQVHFNHITTAYQKFLTKFSQQHTSHGSLLASFESDLAQLARIPLHPGLQTRSGCRTLEDLTPVTKMRQWGEHCRRSHEHFGVKVSELGALLQALKQDVEGLLAQTPSVDLDQLGADLCRAEGAADELSLLVQSLAKDLRSVRELVETAVTQLAAPTAGSTVLDACVAMHSISEAHATQLLPQAKHLDEHTVAFCIQCVDAKNAMTVDVVTQLQRISGQQSRIRDLKAKLAAFTEVLARQEVAFAELKMAQRIPMAYRMMLAECMRQSAWQELYSQQAARLEEHMGKLRSKETSRRTAFLQQVERYLPNEAVAQAGLMQDPPRCTLTINPQQQPLLAVTTADLQWLPIRGPGIRASSVLGLAAAQPPPSNTEMAAEMAYRPPPASLPPSLELEVALLKSELGSHVAAACMRELAASEQATAASPARLPSGAPGNVAASAPPPGLPHQAAAGSAAASATPGPGPSSAPPLVPPWAAPEELLESMRRALSLKDDLLDKLQAQVHALSSVGEEQQRRIQQLEGQAAADAQALAALQQQQQQLVSQLSATTAEATKQQQGGLQGPVLLQHGTLQEGRSLFPSASTNSLGPSGASPSGGTSILAPQPLLLGPIALAALSACRPGSAGPPTLRAAVLPPALAPPGQNVQGTGSRDAQSHALPALAGLTTFASAPIGAMRPAQRHSLGSLNKATALQPDQNMASMQPGQGQGQGPGRDQPSSMQDRLDQMQQQQEEALQSPKYEQQHSGSASGEFGLMTDTFSMHDSMPAEALDEASGPGASSPDDCMSTLRIRPSAARDTQSSGADAPVAFGSLPFASSLPRYGSLAGGVPAAGASPPGNTARRPSVGSSSSFVPPNAVLASVMRVAGQEPEPLPWAHLRQSPPPPAEALQSVARKGLAAGGSAELLNAGLGDDKDTIVAASGATMELRAAAIGGSEQGVEDKEPGREHAADGPGERGAASGRPVFSSEPDVADEDAPDLDDIMGGQE